MNQLSIISKRYAKALYAVVKDKVAALNELRVIIKIISEDTAVNSFFSSSLYSEQQKLEIFDKATLGKGLSEDITHFLKLMIGNGRSNHLQDTLLAYEALVDAENGVTRGVVRSAIKLDSEARHKIESVVSQFIKKKVILNYSEDPKLVGGILAQVCGWTFEDTLDSHLRRLKEDLNRRAN